MHIAKYLKAQEAFKEKIKMFNKNLKKPVIELDSIFTIKEAIRRNVSRLRGEAIFSVSGSAIADTQYNYRSKERNHMSSQAKTIYEVNFIFDKNKVEGNSINSGAKPNKTLKKPMDLSKDTSNFTLFNPNQTVFTPSREKMNNTGKNMLNKDFSLVHKNTRVVKREVEHKKVFSCSDEAVNSKAMKTIEKIISRKKMDVRSNEVAERAKATEVRLSKSISLQGHELAAMTISNSAGLDNAPDQHKSTACIPSPIKVIGAKQVHRKLKGNELNAKDATKKCDAESNTSIKTPSANLYKVQASNKHRTSARDISSVWPLALARRVRSRTQWCTSSPPATTT